jgi:hypothetical protein
MAFPFKVLTTDNTMVKKVVVLMPRRRTGDAPININILRLRAVVSLNLQYLMN